MKEEFLQFVWEFGLFKKEGLEDLNGQEIQIIKLGRLNRDSGPDFHESKVFIGGTEWFGHVEIHIDGQDWYIHGHHKDPNFNSVILHVVWEEPRRVILNERGQEIPTVVLKNRIRKGVYDRFLELGRNKSIPACGKALRKIEKIEKMNWLDNLLVERLENRIDELRLKHQEFKGDWERIALWTLTKHCGGNHNQEPFLRLANLLDPIKVKKYRKVPIRLEAMFLGRAGILPSNPKDGYSAALCQEYSILARMYNWSEEKVLWTYGKIRPLGLPDRRIAVLLAFLARTDNWLEIMLEIAKGKDLTVDFLQPYWWKHYRLGKKIKAEKIGGVPGLGDLWLINAILPFAFFYSIQKRDEALRDRVIDRFTEIKPEQNRVIRAFRKYKVEPEHAGDSQALLHLYKHYCSKWRCFECSWGANLLRKGNELPLENSAKL